MSNPVSRLAAYQFFLYESASGKNDPDSIKRGSTTTDNNKKTSWIVILLHTVQNNTACSQPVIIPSFSSSGRASSIIPKTLGSFNFFIIDLNYGCENSVISYHAEIIFIKIFA